MGKDISFTYVLLNLIFTPNLHPPHFDKLNIGLQRKIALAKERGHVARGMIVKEDAKRLVVNNSQSAYSYWAARYTYTVDGKEYRKRFSCAK